MVGAPSVPNSAATGWAVSSLNAELLRPPALSPRRYNRLSIHLFSVLLTVRNAPPSSVFRKS